MTCTMTSGMYHTVLLIAAAGTDDVQPTAILIFHLLSNNIGAIFCHSLTTFFIPYRVLSLPLWSRHQRTVRQEYGGDSTIPLMQVRRG
jgi:hypothetical protein